MHGFGKTLMYAYRSVRGSVATSLAVVLTFALGIGVTTAVFSIVCGVLLRPLPYPESDRLVRVWLNNPLQGLEKDVTSYPNFLDWREQSRSIQSLAAIARGGRPPARAGSGSGPSGAPSQPACSRQLPEPRIQRRGRTRLTPMGWRGHSRGGRGAQGGAGGQGSGRSRAVG
ncbi:MAG TPA: hypothetical protein VF970_13325 [Gemmatimonadales bacterium]